LTAARPTGGGSIWKLAEVDREPAEMMIEDGRLDEAGKVVAEMEALAERTPWPECHVAATAAMRARGLSVPRRPARSGALLTETEVQLVRLVGSGLPNRQIATAMNYSTKTIEVYLSRIYTKTGCASRLELIRAVDTGSVALPPD
jgi:DNA-binding NarL/FixJ family response regulator